MGMAHFFFFFLGGGGRGVQTFDFSIFLGGFRKMEKNGVRRSCAYSGGSSQNWTILGSSMNFRVFY